MSPFGGIRPGTDLLAKVEERRQNLEHKTPVVGVIGLDDEEAAGGKGCVHESQDLRRQDTQMGLSRVMVGLGMIEVDLGDRAFGHIRTQECLGILDREADVL